MATLRPPFFSKYRLNACVARATVYAFMRLVPTPSSPRRPPVPNVRSVPKQLAISRGFARISRALERVSSSKEGWVAHSSAIS